jgi:alcohol dehydrogenase class IV
MSFSFPESTRASVNLESLAAPRVLMRLIEIRGILEKCDARNVFLVVDRAAYECSNAREVSEAIWRDYSVQEFDGFRSNPRYEDVEAGVAAFRARRQDVIIAIGGGTAIDVAKLIRCGTSSQQTLHEIIQYGPEVERSNTPLIAVPTTAGTGSEATHFAVVYYQGEKHSVAHPSILPEYAVVDYQLTESLPARGTAETGLDALCQAIESMWSIHSTEESMVYSAEALDLIVHHFDAAVRAPTSISREAMSRAAHLAGRAINISKTTAPHAISYKLTHDYGIAHGHAAALTLGAVLVFNAGITDEDNNDPRGVEHVEHAICRVVEGLGCHTPDEAQTRIQDMMTSAGCETRLSQLGIAGDDAVALLASSVNASRLQNNPRRLTTEQLRDLIASIQ